MAGALIGFLWFFGTHQTAEAPQVASEQPTATPQTVVPAAPVLSEKAPPPGRYVVAAATTASEPGEAQSHAVLLRFSAEQGATDPVAIVSRRPRSRPVPTTRGEMPLAIGRLVVAVEDRERNALWRTVIADPRIVRGEFFDADGRIEESVEASRDAAASIVYPQDDRAHRLVVFEPVGDSDDLGLRPIAALDLP